MPQFRIEETISESSTTRVYRAFQIALARRVLLKVLRPHLAGDPVVRERFVREAHACAKLRSEHIVQVYDLTEFENTPAIVMEYVNGHSLKELLSQQPADRILLARKTAIQVLRALTVAHRNGVTHRDIKPGNILVTEEGVLKVTDFGLAHLADSTLVTAEGMVVGTPAYMAPEQVRGDRVDARTDLFSLGATLVEVLTGERIFEGDTHAECIRKVIVFKPEELDRFAGQAPKDFLEFLKRLLQPKPQMRFASAVDALAELHVKEESPDKPGPTTAPSVRKRTPVVLLLAGILIVSSIGALIVLRSYRGTIPATRGGGVQSVDSISRVPTRSADSATILLSSRKIHTVVSSQPSESSHRRVSSSSQASDPASGRVRFTCSPWGKVYVDGQPIGETPFAESVVLPMGKHTVTFDNPTFNPIVKQIIVRADRELSVSANFMNNAGFLRCTVQPWADVYVDEVYRDTTPLSKPIVVSAGKHRVRFHNPSAADVVRVVTILPQDTVNVNVSLN